MPDLMNILAVDTTSAHGSVALLSETGLRAVMGLSSRPKYAQRLLPAINCLLESLELELGDLSGFAVAVGPGSFTGLRVGIASVEGLAFATNKPCVGVSALDATAARFRHFRGMVVAFIDAYRGEVYGARYRADTESVSPVGDPVCESPEAFLARLAASEDEPLLFAGSATESHGDLVRDRFGKRARFAEKSFFIAPEVAFIGAPRLAAGESAALGGLVPLYLRPPEAERNRLGKRP